MQNAYRDSIVNQFISLNFGGQFLVKNTKEVNTCSTATLAPGTVGEHWISQEGCIRFTVDMTHGICIIAQDCGTLYNSISLAQ